MTEATTEQEAGEGRLERHRRRLLAALAGCIVERGLAATTILDIVERAGMSKRDFYRCFRSKDDAFLELYRSAGTRASGAMAAAMAEPGSLEEKVRRGVHAFLALLDEEPGLTRAHFLDVFGLGERGLAARREVLRGYCTAIWQQLERGAGRRRPRTMPEAAMMAAIGGINELTLAVVESGSGAHVTDLEDEMVQVLTPLLQLLG